MNKNKCRKLLGFFGVMAVVFTITATGCNGDPSLPPAFSISAGDLAERNSFFVTDGMTMNEFLLELSWEAFDYAGLGQTIYTDSEKTTPFNGSSIIADADTMFYTTSPLDHYDPVAGVWVNRGEKLGYITGTITINNIPEGVKRVFINISIYDDELYVQLYNRIPISGTAPYSWSIPLYENDGFVAGSNYDAVFWVGLELANDDLMFVDIPVTFPINDVNENVGDLGTVDCTIVTLSGTLVYTGTPIDWAWIDVIDADTGNYLGTTEPDSPASGAAWSITLTPNGVSSFTFDVYIGTGGDEEYYFDVETVNLTPGETTVTDIVLDLDGS